VIDSSLEAVPVVTIDDAALEAAISDVDMAEMAITSDLVIAHGKTPDGAFTLDEVRGVAVVVEKAEDRGLVKCARSWRYTADVGEDPEFPDVSARDADVLRELKALGRL
ncbi:MAG: isoleucine--tRNA ligase, partial [Mesorhizobium sp.]